ncbi:MAG: hypothetical protein IKT40_12430 [Bacilli bacterium]|nr:hypothetical protein [Bacilli bacterium]
MSIIAIKGDKNRGREVINSLKMLGGNNNPHNFLGTNEYNYYYINHNKIIKCIPKELINKDFICLTLEEFLSYCEIQNPKGWGFQ